MSPDSNLFAHSSAPILGPCIRLGPTRIAPCRWHRSPLPTWCVKCVYVGLVQLHCHYAKCFHVLTISPVRHAPTSRPSNMGSLLPPAIPVRCDHIRVRHLYLILSAATQTDYLKGSGPCPMGNLGAHRRSWIIAIVNPTISRSCGLAGASASAQVHYSNSNLKMSLNLPSNVNAVR